MLKCIELTRRIDQTKFQTKFIELSHIVEVSVKTVNIHEAKSQLSKLLDGVTRGEPFVIAKAGKPIARVTAVDAPEAGKVRRVGFLAAQVPIPDDFDRMGEEEILSQFGLDDEPAA